MDLRSIAILSIVCLLAPQLSAGAEVSPRVVDVSTSDGTSLKGTLYGAGVSGPGILLFHQCNRSRAAWDELARLLAASGFQVFTIDFRGFGDSGGRRFTTLSPLEQQQVVADGYPADADAAFQYLSAQPGVQRDRIGAGGASCGVNAAIHLAQRQPEVKSLALLSGSTDRPGREFLRTTQRPLWAAAAADDGNLVQQMRWLLSLPAEPDAHNTFVPFQVGGHGIEMVAAHPELLQNVSTWFNSTLRQTDRVASKPRTRPARESEFMTAIDRPGELDRARQLFAAARVRRRLPRGFEEGIINQLGYERLAGNDASGAIAILTMNIQAFPRSANAYDSLADALMEAGQREAARENAEKAIQLLARNPAIPEARRTAIRENADRKLRILAGK